MRTLNIVLVVTGILISVIAEPNRTVAVTHAEALNHLAKYNG